MPRPNRRRALVLAGTWEARELLLRVRDREVVGSLAGLTRAPALPGEMRIGGFGGDGGFRAALAEFSAVVDATHPFAERITERAARLCAETGTPHLRLTRPPWEAEPHWHHHATLAEAAEAMPEGAQVLVTAGPGGLSPFLGRGLHLWCRRVDPAPPMEGVEWIVGGPAEMAEEVATMRERGITHLVARNSGGSGRCKLAAAHLVGAEIHIVDRPAPPAGGEETHDIDAAVRFVAAHADHRDA
ncbi:precorrin-6A/cobalt-precorrin-6A reductase [Jannaschia sp. W003]|uniref:precorrin-6A/cobalt-precorrin-6A reductase n=1 Tax=Jannaschia sp. W003 TaxID=2867012 RepID=UPI0021A44D5A|nr:precorrin-6A/cobalt-precorrin-6A reductase [Jannaschia sp. W003]UWQ20563.1 precorrin-6A/cobalt-precorrin-6A reductase [Jannaschia sp. W003]